MSALVLAPLLLGAASDATGVLKSLEDAGRSLRTMRAAFVETKVIVLLDEKTESRGELLMQIPGRFRWDYRTPQQSAMVIKDGRFARYFPKSKQVFRGEAKGEAELLVGFGPGAASLGKRYLVTLLPEESVAGRAAHVLELVPHGGGSVFSRIRLWVDKLKAMPVQTRLTEPTGDHTTVRFEGVVINATLAGSAFDLRLPKDVVEVR